MEPQYNTFQYICTNANKPVRLTVHTDNYQIEQSGFYDLNNTYITNPIKLYLLGNEVDIKNKSIKIHSIVTDVNPDNNINNIYYEINGVQIGKASVNNTESYIKNMFITTIEFI